MHPEFGDHLEVLPVIPEDVLKKHHCHHPLDTRFRSAARLLQSIWRSDRALPIGTFKGDDGRVHKLGSRITNAAGRSGFNFLTPVIATAVHRELQYRELGAMIDEERLATNLLSSMPLCFNLFIPLKLELPHATSALHELIPGFAGEVTHVLFEHSPGRGNPQFLADYTAFDVFIRYRSPEGRNGFVAIEVKYSESLREPVARHRERYDIVSEQSGLFRYPLDPALRTSPLQQLFREHLLAETMVEAGLYDGECWFVVIAPEHNHLVHQATASYRALLEPAEAHKVRFLDITLEDLIEVIRLCGPEHAAALHRRYCDWWLVDGELELNAPKFTSFSRTPRRSNRLQIPNADVSDIAPSSPPDGPTADAAPRVKRPRRARSPETA